MFGKKTSQESTDSNTMTLKSRVTKNAAIAAIALVVVCAVFVLWGIITDHNAPATAPSTETRTTAAVANADTGKDASVCGLPAGTHQVLGTAPATQWKLFHKIAVPAAKDLGPGITNAQGLPSCFAHSTVGALYAGAYIAALGNELGSQDLARLYAADSPERDAAMAAENIPASSTSDDVAAIQLHGFTVSAATNDRVVLTIGAVVSNGVSATLALTMVWENGDWKFQMPLDGNSMITTVPDLSGLIPWSGV